MKFFFCLPAAMVLLFWTSCITPVNSGSGAQSAQREAEGSSHTGKEDPDAAANAQASDGEDASRQILLPPTQEIQIDQLMELISPNVPEQFFFLSDDTGQPLRIYHDLDQNGFDDIFFLLVEYPEEGQIDAPPQPPASALVHERRIAASDLADMSRLFSEEIRPHKFYLALFLRSSGGVVSMYRIPLSSWFVFEDFRGFRLDETRPMPYAVSISFQTHEGKMSQWVCFSSYNEFSFFTLKNSLSVTSETRDINNNGILDILEWRRVFEEGTGYETFLTWYKWDGTKFAQHDSTNIVRNLNQFLHSAGTLMSRGKWEQAFSLMLPLEDADMSMGSLFLRLFTALPEKDSGPEVDDAALAAMIDRGERSFSSVIVPRVLENPFAGESQLVKPARHTRFSIRFILRDGRSSVRECRVRMNKNPFAAQQYYLELQPR